jgi:hypothetical protein
VLIVTLFQAYFIGWGLFVSFFGGFFSWRLYSRVDPDHRVKMKRLFVYVEGEREGGREIPRDRETDRPRDKQTDRQTERDLLFCTCVWCVCKLTVYRSGDCFACSAKNRTLIVSNTHIPSHLSQVHRMFVFIWPHTHHHIYHWHNQFLGGSYYAMHRYDHPA